ncbi:MAG: acyl carrier protein [Lysobacter sp.]|nr:MAG: acyl carrier protein [Lysobacter sp.]
MKRAEIVETVLALIQENMGIDRSSLSEATSQTDLGVDSILMVDLMLALEDRLEFSFKSLDLPKNPTIGDIVAMVEKEIASQS